MDAICPVVPRIELGIGLSIVQKELGGSFRVSVTEEVGVIFYKKGPPMHKKYSEFICFKFPNKCKSIFAFV